MTDDAIPAGMFSAQAYDEASRETQRLCYELDITNADHIVLWLEQQLNGHVGPLAYIACRILDAHEAALATPVPSIVTGSDERAREVRGRAFQIGDLIVPNDPPTNFHAVGEVVMVEGFNPGGHLPDWLKITGKPGHYSQSSFRKALPSEVSATLAASRTTDAGAGWVAWNPDSGEEYTPNHPVKSGECVEAERIRRSTPQEDVLWQAFQEQFMRAEALSTVLATQKPPVDELRSIIIDLMAEWPDTHMPSRDLCLRAAAVIGSNLTGDGAGA